MIEIEQHVVCHCIMGVCGVCVLEIAFVVVCVGMAGVRVL